MGKLSKLPTSQGGVIGGNWGSVTWVSMLPAWVLGRFAWVGGTILMFFSWVKMSSRPVRFKWGSMSDVFYYEESTPLNYVPAVVGF